MFKLLPLINNTYYLKCYSNVGVYMLNETEVILIDSADHKKSYTDLDKALTERNLKVKTIINTHSHIDHVTGNPYFQEKYGCDIYASYGEHLLMQNLNLDVRPVYNGIPARRDEDGNIIKHSGVKVKLLQNGDLPEGFETVALPGHSYNMIGVKTPDDVWFIGDSVISKETFDGYKIPYCIGINKTIETAQMLPSLKGKLFVPSHAQPMEDISDIAKYNAEKYAELKNYFYKLCNNKSFEDIFQQADMELDLKLTIDKYAKIGQTIKAILTALMEDGKITAKLQNGKLIYSCI